jgi:hypothetical protein
MMLKPEVTVFKQLTFPAGAGLQSGTSFVFLLLQRKIRGAVNSAM